MDSSRSTILERDTWYQRGQGFWGNLNWQWIAAALFFVAAFVPLGFRLLRSDGHEWLKWFATSGWGLTWAFGISVAYPLWSWGEIRAFEKWVRTKPRDTQDGERAYFKLMMDAAKTFWAAVLATYTIAGLWGLAAKP